MKLDAHVIAQEIARVLCTGPYGDRGHGLVIYDGHRAIGEWEKPRLEAKIQQILRREQTRPGKAK